MGYTICKCGGRKANHAKQCKTCLMLSRFSGNEGMTAQDIGWVAGIVEGEGCFTTNKRTTWLRVSMTDKDIINRLQQVTGVGKINEREDPRPGHKKAYYWTVNSYYNLRWLTKKIDHLLGERRKERIRELGIL